MELKIAMRPAHLASGLRNFCNYVKNNVHDVKVIVEVGSYMGESAEIFAQEFPNATIYCIDPWSGGFDDADACSKDDYNEVEAQFDARTSKYPNIIKYKGISMDYQIPCDIVYIDGCHKYECVVEDISYWKQYATKAISGHDYYSEQVCLAHPHIAGVRKAVNELLGNPTMIFEDGSYIKTI